MSINPFKWHKDRKIERQAKKKAHQEYLERLRVEREAALQLQKQQRFWRRLSSIAVISLIVGFYFIYKNYIAAPEKEWITTAEGVKIYEIRASKNTTYSWKGEILGGCANNKGVLAVQDGTAKSSKDINASWGGTQNADWKNTKHGMFLGKVVGDYPSGFGVLRKGNKTFVGNFVKGSLEGNIREYTDEILSYRGSYSEGAYNGFGTLYKDGQFFAGNWKDGHLSDGYLAEKTNSLSRIANRYLGDDTKTEKKKITKEEIYELDQAEFQQFLATQISDYLEERVTKVVDEKTAFFSFQPIRMFWQSVFSSRTIRTDNWFAAFDRAGLSRGDLEFFMNGHISDYNKNNIYGIQLKNIKLKNIEKDQIINDTAFNWLHDMEIAGWSQNFWLDFALGFLISFMLTSILKLTPLAPVALTIDVVAGIISALIGLVLALIFSDIMPDFIGSIVANYTDFLINQETFNNML